MHACRVLARCRPRLAPLAKAGVPLFAIHGDIDKLVPLDVNSGLVGQRYKSLGREMQWIIPKGQRHNMWQGSSSAKNWSTS